MELPFIIVVITGGLIWWKMKGVKEIALKACKHYCKSLDVQMLDGSILLKALWYRRNNCGQFRLWRRYEFEFTTTGIERHRGQIILLGNAIEHISSDY